MQDRDSHTSNYIRAAMGREMLDQETEHALAVAWRDAGDEAALHRLIRAYARLAISMAGKFRRYGVPMEDLVQQGNLGLMRAAEKYDPDNGARFSTYARWWIKASMQDYVMRNWSRVRTGTNAAQKKLFFNLSRVQARVERAAEGTDATARHAICAEIARELMVPPEQVETMLGRMSGPDLSLNAPQSEAEESREWVELLEDEAPGTEETVIASLEAKDRHAALDAAVGALPERERDIMRRRHLCEEPLTLTELGERMGISKERVRQLEERAIGRLRRSLEATAPGARAGSATRESA